MRSEKIGKRVEIIKEMQPEWEQLAGHFRLSDETVPALKANGLNAVQACREVFDRWLKAETNADVPKTWETVIKVVRRFNAGVADRIRDILEN